MTWIILGASEQLGRCLQDKLKSSAQPFIALSRNALHTADTEKLIKILNQSNPSVVFNCENYFPSNNTEGEFTKTETINSLAPEFLAHWCHKNNSWLIQISTDLVFFDADSSAMKLTYNELDIPQPKSMYAKSKHLGELAASNYCAKHLIVRHGPLFSKHDSSMIDLELLNMPHKAFNNPYHSNLHHSSVFTPTYAPDLALCLIRFATMAKANVLTAGIYHYAGAPAIKRSEFSQETRSIAKDKGLIINDFDIPSKHNIEQEIELAKMVKNLGLNTEKIRRLGVPPSNWRKGVAEVITSYAPYYSN